MAAIVQRADQERVGRGYAPRVDVDPAEAADLQGRVIHGGGGCVVSTFSDRQVGGLTTLAARLFAAADPAVDWTWVVRLDRHGLETTRYDVGGPESRRPGPFGEVRTVAPRPASSLLLKRTGWTIFQAGGPVVAPRLFGLGYRPSVRRQVPADTGLVYWVGAGIELLGFEALAAARRAGAPFVVLPALHPGVWGDTAIDARLYRSADAVVALSESERALLEGFGVDPKRIEAIRPGPTVLEGGDGPRFRAAHGIGPDEPVVAFLGRRARYKGLAATVEAVRRL